jgi:hypothetical protein
MLTGVVFALSPATVLAGELDLDDFEELRLFGRLDLLEDLIEEIEEEEEEEFEEELEEELEEEFEEEDDD